jgi:hypothetical protein
MIDRAQILFLAVLGCALQMHAQWNPAATSAFGAGMGPIALMTGNLSLGHMTREGTTNSGAATNSVTAPNAKELVFEPNPAVSTNVHQKIAQILLSHAPPEKRAAVEQELSKFDPVPPFNSTLMKSGFSPHDLADVTTAYVADCWQLMNDAPDPPQATLLALNQQLRRALLKDHVLAKMNNGEKQQTAEIMAYEVVLNLTLTRIPNVQNDPSRRAQAQESLAIQFKQVIGLDLRHLDLTPSGLRDRP